MSIRRVEKILKDGKWHSLKEISKKVKNKRADLAALVRMFSIRKNMLRKYESGEVYYRMA